MAMAPNSAAIAEPGMMNLNKTPQLMKVHDRKSFRLLSALLYFDYYLSFMVILFTFFLSLFKGSQLYFPSGQWLLEFLVLIYWAMLTYARISAGENANRTQSSSSSVAMLSFALFAIAGNYYFLDRQTYILKVEIPIHAASLIFTVFEFLIGLATLVAFK